MHSKNLISLFLLAIPFWGLAQPVPAPSDPKPTQEDYLEIQYQSVGCFKLKYGDVAILTDPFWTHLSALTAMYGKVVSDSAQVEPYLPPLHDIMGILVCHAHYDHALEIPYVSPRIPASSPIIGSKTLKHVLAPFELPQPTIVVNDIMATPDEKGEWITLANGKIRVLAVKAGHPNHLLFIHLWGKKLTEDRTRIPTRGRHWQEGETLGFLIDFLAEDGEEIRYRVFFQSSSTPYPAGFFPQSILDVHPVDAALLGRDFVEMEQKGELNVMPSLKAKTVIFCHWENFFQPKSKPPKKSLIKKWEEQVAWMQENDTSGTRFLVPAWGATYYFTNP